MHGCVCACGYENSVCIDPSKITLNGPKEHFILQNSTKLLKFQRQNSSYLFLAHSSYLFLAHSSHPSWCLRRFAHVRAHTHTHTHIHTHTCMHTHTHIHKHSKLHLLTYYTPAYIKVHSPIQKNKAYQLSQNITLQIHLYST